MKQGKQSRTICVCTTSANSIRRLTIEHRQWFIILIKREKNTPVSSRILTRKGKSVQVGFRTSEQLSWLSWNGYFVKRNQRITNESREGGRFPEIRLWDDWERRHSHLWASDIATLIEVAHLDISSWSWYPNGSKADGAK